MTIRRPPSGRAGWGGRPGIIPCGRRMNPAQPLIDIRDHGPLPGTYLFALCNLRGRWVMLGRAIMETWAGRQIRRAVQRVG